MNALRENILNKIVVLQAEELASHYQPLHCRLFLVTMGHGAQPDTLGRKIFGRLLFDQQAPGNEHGVEAMAYGFQVERLATEEDLQVLEQARRAAAHDLRLVLEE